MVQFWKTNLENLMIHQVGNKSLEEGVLLTNSLANLKQSEKLINVLLNFFLKSFKDLPAYSFAHPANLKMNDVYNIAGEIFGSPRKIVKSSQDLAKILYELSSHPKIKSGELYVAYFSDCQYHEKILDAIGIFKSESTETFLKINHNKNTASIDIEDGINTGKLDKGCLILNYEMKNGYIVYSIDNTSKGNDTLYWKNDFLNLKPLNDNYHYTSNILQLTKQFVISDLLKDNDLTKADQIEYLNKSMSYFKENEKFNIKEFQKEIFKDADVIKSFQKFGSSYLDENDIDIADTFEISSQAVKKQARVFKSVIKLDKNFHIYIHGNRDLIEQGYDSKTGKRFYKIYFDKES